ncbi:hypothetical protein NWFMUON74_38430 [Nocardia wallacei]|uniref:Uncharacterized protein n=1 Tax=Nocardia wallacei TaxID=480035 RepID=A0A7G1KML7_9NOCA|nr:hypothetical protein NWFMUON74_38430 [Nocardia wallacei]
MVAKQLIRPGTIDPVADGGIAPTLESHEADHAFDDRGNTVNWPTAAVLIALLIAITAIASTYIGSRGK